ncbi:MAG: hypothetical protein ACW99U_02970 [Candidatus Thorarchaeota archaeon]|jgi:hypothetical protein
MTSEDLKRFYELYFEKGFQIHGFSLEHSHDTGYKTEVELFKDEKREVIKSNEEDFARVLLRFQKTVDSDGSIKLARIGNSKKYFEAIKEFTEHREIKISKALDDWKSGKSPVEGGFWHDVDRALVKLLFEKTSPEDSDVLWLRENYFHIFAFYLAEAKGITGVGKDALFHKHKDIQPLIAITERILRDAFLSNQKTGNPVEIYKTYRRLLPDSLEDQTERVSIQLAYLDDLRAMIKEVGSRKERVRILYVLDVYRRVYEMTRPILDLLRIAAMQMKGKPTERDVSDDEIISILKEDNYSELVDAFNPQIRHCESHLATKIREDKRTVLLTKREGLRRSIIQEFSYEEIVSYQERLYDLVFPALFYAVSSFDGFLKIMLMDSLEYQLLLISKTATK